MSRLKPQGCQETGIDEGIIFGGIFEEDSTGVCISLSPSSSQSDGYNEA